jgi:PAS domain S-box-containing protein
MSNKRTRSDDRVLRGGLPGKVSAPKGTRRSLGASPRKLPTPTPLDQQEKLSARLKAAEGTLDAIHSGEVDAFVVSSRRGARVITLAGGEPAYRMLVEAMSEGAATLSRDGTVIYCNGRLAELIDRSPTKVIGVAVQSLVVATERDRFKALLAAAQKTAAKGEFNLRCKDGSLAPVHLSLNRLQGYDGNVLGMVITDLSEQKRRQAEEIKQAEEIHRLILDRAFMAQEEERKRIARELHDEAGQMLTSLLVGLRTLEDSTKEAAVKAHGRRLRKIAAQTIEEIGRLARGLHPTVLDDHGLNVALSRYVAEFTETHKIAVHLTWRGFDSGTLPRTVQTRLYRILQEALTNVARHSGAKKVSIRFACSATVLSVVVVDDGCGFDAEAVVASTDRLGILGMRERVAMLGGTVRFSSPGKGTRILVQIPLHQRDPQPLLGQTST